jgi:glycosyltransferase involved in cell wall biosynthesis
MSDICFITTCMGRLAHLRETLGQATAQRDASCVVVDYSCPERCGEWVERSYPQVRVVRPVGETRFQVAAARNLGAQAADAPWLCFFDADIVVDPFFAEAVRPMLQPGCYYVVNPWTKGLTGMMVCSRADFDRAGGYDEVIQGWGCEDTDLYVRMGLLGVKQRAFPAHLVRQLSHGDDVRVQFYDVKDMHLSHTINQLYMRAKLDLMKVSGQRPSLQERRALYERAGTVVRSAWESGRQVPLRIEFCRRNLPAGWDIRGALTYVMHPKGSE